MKESVSKVARQRKAFTPSPPPPALLSWPFSVPPPNSVMPPEVPAADVARSNCSRLLSVLYSSRSTSRT